MPIQWKSPNQIDPTTTFTAFLMAVLAGAKRFAHANRLRNDRALHAVLGLSRFPTDDTIRNLFRRFGMGHVHRFFDPLAEWQMGRLPTRSEGYSLGFGALHKNLTRGAFWAAFCKMTTSALRKAEYSISKKNGQALLCCGNAAPRAVGRNS